MNRFHEIADTLQELAGEADPTATLNLELAVAHLRAAARLHDGLPKSDRSNTPEFIHQDVVRGWRLQQSLSDPKGFIENGHTL